MVSRATIAQMSRKTPSVRKRCTHPGAGGNANVHTAHPMSMMMESGNAACLSGDEVVRVAGVLRDVESGIGVVYVVIDASWNHP